MCCNLELRILFVVLPVNAFVLFPEVLVEVAVEDGVGEGVTEAEEMEDRVDNGFVALDERLH